MSKNSWQRQHKIDQQAAKISSLEAQNQILAQLLETKFLVETITKAVASNLNINMDKKSQQGEASGYTGRPYLGKARPSKLALGIDGSLDPELSCWYCKDTGHLKENCIKLNRRLAYENKQPDWLPKKLENWDLLWSWTNPKERMWVVLTVMRIKMLDNTIEKHFHFGWIKNGNHATCSC